MSNVEEDVASYSLCHVGVVLMRSSNMCGCCAGVEAFGADGSRACNRYGGGVGEGILIPAARWVPRSRTITEAHDAAIRASKSATRVVGSGTIIKSSLPAYHLAQR